MDIGLELDTKTDNVTGRLGTNQVIFIYHSHFIYCELMRAHLHRAHLFIERRENPVCTLKFGVDLCMAARRSLLCHSLGKYIYRSTKKAVNGVD